MSLIPHTIEDVGELIEKFEGIVSHLQAVRGGMAADGIDEVPLQTLKAKRYLKFLVPWAIDVESEFRKARATAKIEASARKGREKIEEKRTAATRKKKL